MRVTFAHFRKLVKKSNLEKITKKNCIPKVICIYFKSPVFLFKIEHNIVSLVRNVFKLNGCSSSNDIILYKTHIIV